MRLGTFDRRLLAGPPEGAARHLLGALLVREADGTLARRVGRIVEVEAYGDGRDLASHARFGRTRRTAPMFGAAGTAYVYLVYGMHACLNVVTGTDGTPAAVLIRAVEPVTGVEAMRAAREQAASASAHSRDRAALRRRLASVPAHRLASGPGLVGAALGVSPQMSGIDLLDPDGALHLEAEGEQLAGDAGVVASARIGIAYAAAPWREIGWRFHLRDHPSVSGRTSGG